MKIEGHATGSFCISVLRTRDARRARAFYGSLFGWATGDGPETGLRFFQHDGAVVAGLRQVEAGEDTWVPHVCVEDVERAAREAVALGGRETERFDADGVARLATITDPEGAVFGLWQPAPHPGAGRLEEVGSVWWLEVLANDVARTSEFYGRLFGWGQRGTSFDPFARYVVFERNGRQEGGLLPISPEWHVSPHWNTIVAVADGDAAVESTKRLGGCEIFVHTVPTAGRIAVLSDPGDALFVVRGPVPAGTDRAGA